MTERETQEAEAFAGCYEATGGSESGLVGHAKTWKKYTDKVPAVDLGIGSLEALYSSPVPFVSPV